MKDNIDYQDKLDETRAVANALNLAIRGLEDRDDRDALEVLATRLGQCLTGLSVTADR